MRKRNIDVQPPGARPKPTGTDKGTVIRSEAKSTVLLIAVPFEHCVLRVLFAWCVMSITFTVTMINAFSVSVGDLNSTVR